MNLIKNTAQQLVRRRLWPVALLLVAALVAVPMTLAKSPAPAAPAPQVAVAAHASDAAANTPIVELATPDASSHARRRVLGQAKDPFAPAPLPKAKKSKKQAEATPTPAATTDAGSGSGSGSDGGATAPTGTAPPSATPVPTVTMPKSSVKVRFGLADETAQELPTTFVRRLEPLVANDVPVLVFERLTSGDSAAIFSIPGDVTAVGDGSCDPSPQDCETLKLHAGQTEFITVTGASDSGGDLQYELDLVKIFAKATKVPKSELDPSATGAGS